MRSFESPAYSNIELSDGGTLECSPTHQVKASGKFELALNLKGEDVLYDDISVKSNLLVEESIQLYSILGVDGEEYLADGMVHHNCAFIENIDEIWTSAQPTLSTGGKSVIISTPNGQGNFFHKMWSAAVNGENDFNFIKLDWRVVPGRDDEWRQAQSKAIGDERLASQEHDAEFIGSGNTVIDEYITKWYEDTYVKEPIGTAGFDDNLWVWEHPNYTKKYILCADVARGDASDYSTFHVLDAESCTQVAEYKGKLTPQAFAHLIISTATSYNDAVVVIDNSTIGYGVIQVLLEREYKNLFWMSKDLQYVDPDDDFLKKYYKSEKNSVPGFTISHRTRPLIVSKLVDYFSDKSVIIRSSRTCSELYTFIWNNGKPEAVRGTNDDLVIALAMGLWIRDTALVVHELSSEMTKATVTGIRLNRGNSAELAHVTNTRTGQIQTVANPYIYKTRHGGGGLHPSSENIFDLRELLR